MSYAAPPIIAELERAIGIAATLELVRKCGGTREYIPRPPELGGRNPPGSRLAGLIGVEAAHRLGAVRGGDSIEIPRCAALLRRRRDLEIVRRLEAGETTRALAREFGLTERSIWTIAEKAELAENADEALPDRQSAQLELPWVRSS